MRKTKNLNSRSSARAAAPASAIVSSRVKPTDGKRRQPRLLPGTRFDAGHNSVPLLTATEVGQVLRMPRPTVYFHTREGRIPSVKIGGRIRFALPEIERILKVGIPSPSEAVERPLGKVAVGALRRQKPLDSELNAAPILFAGITGDDPALRSWLQWTARLQMTPIILPLKECHRLAGPGPGILVINGAVLKSASEKAVSSVLNRLHHGSNHKLLLVILHEDNLSGDLVEKLLKNGPTVFCPKHADGAQMDQMRQIVANFLRSGS